MGYLLLLTQLGAAPSFHSVSLLSGQDLRVPGACLKLVAGKRRDSVHTISTPLVEGGRSPPSAGLVFPVRDVDTGIC